MGTMSKQVLYALHVKFRNKFMLRILDFKHLEKVFK